MQEAGRWLKFDSGVGICPGQMHTEARYRERGKMLLDERLGLVLGLWCPLENGNFKKFCQYFLSKLSFDKTKLGFCILPSKFFWIFVKMGFSSSSAGYHGISNQSFIWFEFREKVEYWGEKMKTHVSKISPGSRAHGSASGEVKSHKDLRR